MLIYRTHQAYNKRLHMPHVPQSDRHITLTIKVLTLITCKQHISHKPVFTKHNP